MNKQEFLAALRARLSALPREELEQSLEYYREMIDDRVEEGLSEEEAVAALGSVEEIAAQILKDRPARAFTPPPAAPQPAPAQKKGVRPWVVVLLILGSPIWASLLFAAAMTVFGLLMGLLGILVGWYAILAAFAAGGIAGLIGAVALLIGGYGLNSLMSLGIGLTFAGLTILMVLGSIGVTKGIVYLTKALWRGIRRCFSRKGAAQ